MRVTTPSSTVATMPQASGQSRLHTVLSCTRAMLHPAFVQRLLLALGGVALFVGVLFFEFFPHPIIDGDTAVLLQGAHQVSACLVLGNRPCGGSWHFPLLQYVEAVLLLRN